MNKLAAYIPNELQLIIYKQGKEEYIKVYRIAKKGIINEDVFLSSYEERKRGLIEGYSIADYSEAELQDVSTYSTSCFLNYKKAQKSLKFFMKHNPPAKLIEGRTIYGLVQKTYERTHEPNQKYHLDWWIYQGCLNKLIAEFNFCNKEGETVEH